MADRIYQPGIGPTRNRSTAEALDATVANPDSICAPLGFKITLTTTLYPVEVKDSIKLAATVDAGYMTILPNDSVQNAYSLLAGTNTQKRWFFYDGPYEDSVDNLYSLLDGTNTQKRWFFSDGPYDDSVKNAYSLLDGTSIRGLVRADTPDEKLKLSTVIRNTCTMDLV